MANFPEFLANCRFFVALNLEGSIEAVDAYFMECQGFQRTQEAIEICEVTPQQWGKAKRGQIVSTKLPGNIKNSNIVLRRGMTSSMTLWNWVKAMEEGEWFTKRRDGSLTIYNQAAVATARFEFKRAWPTRYKISDLLASGGELEIEEIEVAVEDFKRVAVS